MNMSDQYLKSSALASDILIACVAGGISLGVLYCFAGEAARRVGIQANLKSRLLQFWGILSSAQPGLREFLIAWEAIKRQSNDN